MRAAIASRAAIAALFLALIASCGGSGGSSSSSGAILPAPELRKDLLFGYYGMNAAAATEASAHINLVFAADFYGPLEQMAALTQARGLGMRAVLMIPAYGPDCVPQPASELRFWLQRLANAGLLWDGIVALYPIDEPGACTAAVITAQNAVLRQVMSEFPAIAHAKLAVIYACKGNYPGASSYDVIGCDDYDSGCAVFARYYGPLREAAPQAKLLAIAGGADPWRQDPACFETYVHGTPEAWALLGFIYQTVTDQGHTMLGIRENGLRPLYCQAGRKIRGELEAVCG